MKKVDDAVKWVCGMALVIAGLWLLSQFLIDYNQAQQRLRDTAIASQSTPAKF